MNMSLSDLLAGSAEAFGVELTDEQLAKFKRYAELLLIWNQKMNLTAIETPEEIVVKHFVDSMSVLFACEFPQNASVIDVGTGAGFPGVVLKIVRPDLELYLLDSLRKRLTFLETLCEELGLAASVLHLRAEEGGRQPALREAFDFATARAVAWLAVLAEYCLPFVKPGGRFIAMKGPAVDDELQRAKGAIACLGGQILSKKEVYLPDGSGRTLIEIKKVSQTPTKYPRHSAKITKYPL